MALPAPIAIRARNTGVETSTYDKALRELQAPFQEDDAVDTLLGRPGVDYSDFCSTWVVAIDDGALPDHMDDDVAASTEMIQGRYFRIGTLGGRPCFRQERSTDPCGVNSHQLFLWHNSSGKDDGWYFSNAVGMTTEGITHYAWAADFIIQVHVPYWAKKPMKAVRVLSQVQLADEQTLGVEPDAKRRKGEPVNMKGFKQQPPSGWMNKCVGLMAAVLSNDMDAARAMAEQYRCMNDTVKDLVDKKLNGGKYGKHGKW